MMKAKTDLNIVVNVCKFKEAMTHLCHLKRLLINIERRIDRIIGKAQKAAIIAGKAMR
jgi:hypothetical protein